MPEAMDLFQVAVPDHPAVRYQSVASYAPGARASDWLGAVLSPWNAVSATLFLALSRITAPSSKLYTCAPAGEAAHRSVQAKFGEVPKATANDGIVPFYSQIYGELLWVGMADHLDIVGHFPGARGHRDWLASGARFSSAAFDVVMSRIVDGMVTAECTSTR